MLIFKTMSVIILIVLGEYEVRIIITFSKLCDSIDRRQRWI